MSKDGQMPTNEQLQEVLFKITDLISSLREEPVILPGLDIGCTIKQLDSSMMEQAAEHAININPTNGVSFGPTALAGLDTPLKIAVMVSKYWGPIPRTLTVSFMDNPSTELRRKIINHFNAWTKTGCISFAETGGVGDIRVSRGPGGYYSYLGTDIMLVPKNQNTMNLEGFTMNTPDSEFYRVVRHEVCHSLGCPHEHMRRQLVARIDRQKAYNYFLQTQGWDRQTVDQQVLTPLEERSIRGTVEADQDSIMCYQLPGQITLDGQPIRGGNDINEADYAFIGKIYPKQGVVEPPPPVCNCSRHLT